MAIRASARSCAALVAALFPIVQVFGQPTNAEILGRLISDCAMSAAGTADTVLLIPDQRYEFLRTAVVNSLQEAETVVLVTLGTGSGEDAGTEVFWSKALRYHIEDSEVSYSKAGKSLQREITLNSRILLTARSALVLSDTLCTRSYSDEIERSDLAVIENPLLEITVGDQPQKGWLRRIAEPAVVAAASAVVVYLFFNVRSDKSDSR